MCRILSFIFGTQWCIYMTYVSLKMAYIPLHEGRCLILDDVSPFVTIVVSSVPRWCTHYIGVLNVNWGFFFLGVMLYLCLVHVETSSSIGVCISGDIPFTGWGRITSLNFKVNNQKAIQDRKVLFLDSETTTWEVLNHIVLKRISCKWWLLLSVHCCRLILIFCITLSNISCSMRATSRRIASSSACRVLGRCLNTSAFRYPHKK